MKRGSLSDSAKKKPTSSPKMPASANKKYCLSAKDGLEVFEDESSYWEYVLDRLVANGMIEKGTKPRRDVLEKFARFATGNFQAWMHFEETQQQIELQTLHHYTGTSTSSTSWTWR